MDFTFRIGLLNSLVEIHWGLLHSHLEKKTLIIQLVLIFSGISFLSVSYPRLCGFHEIISGKLIKYFSRFTFLWVFISVHSFYFVELKWNFTTSSLRDELLWLRVHPFWHDALKIILSSLVWYSFSFAGCGSFQ